MTSWHDVIGPEKEKDYFKNIMSYVEERRLSGVNVYPPRADVFNAFKYTALEDLRVVIIGQDPMKPESLPTLPSLHRVPSILT